jgi:transcriptional regulator GlxA family with amidase domain
MIATQVGYTNRESFRRAFHAHFGINPASVRSSH